MDDLCIHDQFRSTCTICTPTPRLAEPPETVRMFPAKYASQCHGCNLPIMVGERVAWLPGRPAVHEHCYGEDVAT